jgi:hypothetical protein
MALTHVTVPHRDSYDFGIGVDFASGSPMGKVVEGAISGVTGAGGARASWDILRIHTTSELETALGINVEASMGLGCFSASARLDFAKSCKIQNSSLFMAITAQVELESLSIDEPTLSPAALRVVERDDVFTKRFGNMFVRGIRRGGLFVGVMQINTMNAEDSESISAELEGSYGLFSAEAKTKFSEIQKKYRSETRITVYHEGGPIDLSMHDINDPNQLYLMLQKWLASFKDNPAENARPYYATLAPITIANGPPPSNAADIQHAQDVLILCAKDRSRILDQLNLVEFISQNVARYDFAAPTTPADIVKAFTGLQADLDLVAAAASQAINHVSEALTPAEFAAKKGRVYPQGILPTPMPTLEKGMMDVMAAKGRLIANAEPLFAALREREPEGPSRRGFDIGIAAAEGHTLPGPGKDKIRDGLSPAEQIGFATAVSFTLERNNNVDFATRGAAIARVNPVVAAARTVNPSIRYWLGFDIATGIFGDPALGGQGSTLTGPGSMKIRSSLSPEGQNGFDASVKLHLGPPPLPRQA